MICGDRATGDYKFVVPVLCSSTAVNNLMNGNERNIEVLLMTILDCFYFYQSFTHDEIDSLGCNEVTSYTSYNFTKGFHQRSELNRSNSSSWIALGSVHNVNASRLTGKKGRETSVGLW